MWRADEAYLAGLDFFDQIVNRAGDAWDAVSPCNGWTAKDVVGHVGAGAKFGADMLRGEKPAWSPSPIPGADVKGDPAGWWRDAESAVRSALEGVDLNQVLDSPKGKRSVSDGLSFPAVDLFVHGWDLAAATGQTVEIPAAAIEYAHHVLDAMPAEQLRSPTVFGDEVSVGSDASESDRFLGWTGRDPSWHA